MIIDSGSPINIIDRNTFNTMQKQKPFSLKHTNKTVFSYGNKTPLKLIGCFQPCIESKKRFTVDTVYVTNVRNAGNLIGMTTATALKLLHVSSEKKSTNNKTIGSLTKKAQR